MVGLQQNLFFSLQPFGNLFSPGGKLLSNLATSKPYSVLETSCLSFVSHLISFCPTGQLVVAMLFSQDRNIYRTRRKSSLFVILTCFFHFHPQLKSRTTQRANNPALSLPAFCLIQRNLFEPSEAIRQWSSIALNCFESPAPRQSRFQRARDCTDQIQPEYWQEIIDKDLLYIFLSFQLFEESSNNDIHDPNF